MIENREGNLLLQTDLDVIAHQANCFCTFGSGIAKQIREQFPEAYEADCRTASGDMGKLGTFSHALIRRDGRKKFIIANLYGQGGYGKRRFGGRDTNYDALYDAMAALKLTAKNMITSYEVEFNLTSPFKIGLPYMIGSALGGGSWRVVEAMIRDIFEDETALVCVICKFVPPAPSK